MDSKTVRALNSLGWYVKQEANKVYDVYMISTSAKKAIHLYVQLSGGRWKHVNGMLESIFRSTVSQLVFSGAAESRRPVNNATDLEEAATVLYVLGINPSIIINPFYKGRKTTSAQQQLLNDLLLDARTEAIAVRQSFGL